MVKAIVRPNIVAELEPLLAAASSPARIAAGMSCPRSAIRTPKPLSSDSCSSAIPSSSVSRSTQRCGMFV